MDSDCTNKILSISPKISAEEISILLKARGRLHSITNKTITEINLECSKELARITQYNKNLLLSILERTNSVLSRIETAIISNIALRSSTDDFLHDLNGGIKLLEKEQNNYRRREKSYCFSRSWACCG